MATNYKKIEAAVDRLTMAWNENNRIASLRIGMISGGPSIHEELVEAQAAFDALTALVQQALDSGCREARMFEVVKESKLHRDMVQEHFDNIRAIRQMSHR